MIAPATDTSKSASRAPGHERGGSAAPGSRAGAPASEPPSGDRVRAPRAGDRDDGLAAVLARSVQRRLLQRFRVPHLPTMELQLFHASIIPPFFVDLNCGWYCEVAAVQQRAAQRGLVLPDMDVLLPKNTRMAYHPWYEGKELVAKIPTPDDVAAWDRALQAVGPIIVSGKLGAADWGPLGGVGHFILIVGADTNTGELEYLDPLQGDRLKSGSHRHMAKRMEDKAYFVDDDKLRHKLGAPAAPALG